MAFTEKIYCHDTPAHKPAAYMTVGGCMLCCITYRILRQSRPSRRRWTASSSSWPSPRRRLLPPAAAPLQTTESRDRGQHSAAASDNTTCRETLRSDDATLQGGSSASASQRTAPERDARCVDHRAQSQHSCCGVPIGCEVSQSKHLRDPIGCIAPRGETNEWQLGDSNSVSRIKLSYLLSLTQLCHVTDTLLNLPNTIIIFINDRKF